jgi:hypothetical protein
MFPGNITNSSTDYTDINYNVPEILPEGNRTDANSYDYSKYYTTSTRSSEYYIKIKSGVTSTSIESFYNTIGVEPTEEMKKVILKEREYRRCRKIRLKVEEARLFDMDCKFDV